MNIAKAKVNHVTNPIGYRMDKINYKLGKVDAIYPSSAGTYEIHWDIPDLYTVHMKITIPAGCKAKVTLPNISINELNEKYLDNALVMAMKSEFVAAGEYEITYKVLKPLARIFTIEDTLNDIWCDPFASKVLKRVYPKIYEYILWFRRMKLKAVLDNHKEGNEEIYKKLNDAFYEDAVSR